MDYEQIIHEYIDGSLEAGRELELFSVLAQNDELRLDFRNQIAIKNAIRSDVRAFTPKAESTMKIFSTLGFEAPVSVPTPIPTPIATGFWASLGLSGGKVLPLILTSILSAGLTAALMLLFFKPEIYGLNDNNGYSNSLNNSNIAVIKSNSNIEPENNYLKYFVNDKNGYKKSENITPKIIYKYVLVERQNGIENGLEKTEAINKIIKTSKDELNLITESGVVPVKIRNSKLMSNKLMPENISNPFNLNDLADIFNLDKDLGLGIEVRGNEAFYQNKERISPSEKQQFNNSAIAVFYKPMSEFAVGFEYRRENFYQIFKGYENNKLFQFEQQPNYQTYNIAFRYIPEYAKYIFLQPFAQLSYGITDKSGQIGRFMLGAEISPNKGWTFMMGAEYNMLAYNYQSNNFYSDKFGLNFGLAFKF